MSLALAAAEHISQNCPPSAPFYGFMGIVSALVFACIGSAYGTAKAGVGVAAVGAMHPHLIMKSVIPVVMAGIIGIYGLIVAVIISTSSDPTDYSLYKGYMQLAGGLAVGLCGLAAGMAIGIVAEQDKVFVGMVLILIFAEALALYGLIIGIILTSKTVDDSVGHMTVVQMGIDTV